MLALVSFWSQLTVWWCLVRLDAIEMLQITKHEPLLSAMRPRLSHSLSLSQKKLQSVGNSTVSSTAGSPKSTVEPKNSGLLPTL